MEKIKTSYPQQIIRQVEIFNKLSLITVYIQVFIGEKKKNRKLVCTTILISHWAYSIEKFRYHVDKSPKANIGHIFSKTMMLGLGLFFR